MLPDDTIDTQLLEDNQEERPLRFNPGMLDKPKKIKIAHHL